MSAFMTNGWALLLTSASPTETHCQLVTHDTAAGWVSVAPGWFGLDASVHAVPSQVWASLTLSLPDTEYPTAEQDVAMKQSMLCMELLPPLAFGLGTMPQFSPA